MSDKCTIRGKRIIALQDKHKVLVELESQLQSAHCKAMACRLFNMAMMLEGRAKEVSREILTTREAIDNEKLKCPAPPIPTPTAIQATVAPASITITGPFGARSIVLVSTPTGATIHWNDSPLSQSQQKDGT